MSQLAHCFKCGQAKQESKLVYIVDRYYCEACLPRSLFPQIDERELDGDQL